MLVVIPFHAGDKPQAIALAHWIKELGQVSDHKCLLCIGENCDEKGVIEPLHQCFKSTSVYLPHAKAKRGEGIMGYARAANAMWQSVAWKIYMQDKCPWLWLEPDAIPTRPTWLREIEDEYRAFKKPFMGAMGQCQIPMINGVAVYPASVCDYAPLALQAAECPWDLNAHEQILKHAHVSDLFQHIYQIEGQPPTFPKNADRLNQSAALFHRCKDSSLIAHLKQHGYTSGVKSKPYENPNFNVANTEVGVSILHKPKPASSADKRIPTDWQVDQEAEGLGEPVDYSKRLDEFDRTRPRARVPNEGERIGDLVWRGGKWHTAPMMTEKPDHRAVIEKFKHPENLPVPVSAEPESSTRSTDRNRSSQREPGEDISAAASGEKEDSPGGQNPLPAPGTDDGPSGARISDDGPKTDTGAVQPPVWKGGNDDPDYIDEKGERRWKSGLGQTQRHFAGQDMQPMSREEVIKDAVAILKKLCTAPRYTNQIRKELKKQGVVK